jgi:hypothetical protein
MKEHHREDNHPATQTPAQRWFKHHHPPRDPVGSTPTMTASPVRTTLCPCSRKWHLQHGKPAAMRLDVVAEPARATVTVA